MQKIVAPRWRGQRVVTPQWLQVISLYKVFVMSKVADIDAAIIAKTWHRRPAVHTPVAPNSVLYLTPDCQPGYQAPAMPPPPCTKCSIPPHE